MLAEATIAGKPITTVAAVGVLAYCLVSIAILWAYARTRVYPLYLLKICWIGLTIVGFTWIISMSFADPGPTHGGVSSEFMRNPAGPFAALGQYTFFAKRLYASTPWWMLMLFGLLLLWRGLVGHPQSELEDQADHLARPVFRILAGALSAAAAAVIFFGLSKPMSAGLERHLRYLLTAWSVAVAVSAVLVPRRRFLVIFCPVAAAGAIATFAAVRWGTPAGGVTASWAAVLPAGSLAVGALILPSAKRLRQAFLPVSAAGLLGLLLLLDRRCGPTHLRYTGGAFFAAGCVLWAALPLAWRQRYGWAALLLLGAAAAAPLVVSFAQFDWGAYKYVAGNYAFAWKTARMGKYVLNSLLVSVLTVGITSLCASMAAHVLTRFEFIGRNAVLLAFVGAMVIPAQLYIVPLFLMVQNWQVTAGAVHFSFMDSRLGLALIYAAGGLPFAIFLLTGFYRTLPGTLREAAAIDGCGEWRTFSDVYFPLAAPGIATAAIFQFLGVWNEYQFALVFLTNEKLKTLPVGLYNLSVSQQYAANWSALFAGVTILCLPTFLIFVILQERIVAGLTLGAVKE